MKSNVTGKRIFGTTLTDMSCFSPQIDENLKISEQKLLQMAAKSADSK